MKIASWNVNSIRARLEQVKNWLTINSPDMLLMQELKGAEFPSAVFADLGYKSAAVTQKTYNGVAILSKMPLQVISTRLPGDDQDSHARFLETRIEDLRIVNIYAPNGNPPGSEKFQYKLAWMDRFAEVMRQWLSDPVPTIVAGDFNVIPEDIDCHKPSSWMHDALFQPEPRQRFRALLQSGYTDVFRSLHPGEPGHFTYWDYFRRAFEYNRGIRIDHFLVSPQLITRIEKCVIDRLPRAGEKPSDHAPIVLDLR